jgi:hypothetical protein
VSTRHWSSSGIYNCWWELLYFYFLVSISGVCSHLWACVCYSDWSFFLLCVSTCGPIYAIDSMGLCMLQWWVVLPVACICMWSYLCASVFHSDGSFFLLCVSACGPIYALAYSIMMGLLPVVCICMWSHLWASVSHSDGSFCQLYSVRCVAETCRLMKTCRFVTMV